MAKIKSIPKLDKIGIRLSKKGYYFNTTKKGEVSTCRGSVRHCISFQEKFSKINKKVNINLIMFVEIDDESY